MRISLLAPLVAAAVLSPLTFAASAATAASPEHAARTAAVGGETAADEAPHAIGLAHDQLIAFSTHSPGHARSIGHVHGLSGDTNLIGIDYRVQNGALYGVGNQGGIYTLDTHNAKAKKVSQLTVDLDGEYFGVDFNPAADRLRVISDRGQNLRHNIDDKKAPRTTTVDGKLTNPATPPSTTTPTAKGVTGAGYTNNDLDSDTATTLFDVDTVNDRVSLQSPANAGSLAPTGNLGVKAGQSAGFDVHYAPKSGTNHGLATLHVNGAARLYSIDLLTGEATHKGDFPSDLQVTDLAVALDRKPQGGMHTGGGALASATLTPGGGVHLNAAGAAAGALLLLGGIGAGTRIISRRTNNTNRAA